MAWHFGLTTLDGTAIGEIQNAYERRLTIPLNGLPTASFRIRLDNPLANEITDLAGDVRLKVYQDSTLRFHGELTGAEEIGADGASLACTFAGPLWRLQKRMCLNALVPPDPNAVSFVSTDRAQILKTLLDRANAVSETGIQGGTYAALYPALAGEWNYKPLAEAFTEMAASGAFFFETATGAVALDNFNGMGVGDTLIGRAASAGGTWSVSGGGGGDTHPWVGYGGTGIARTAVSDVDVDSGRWGFLSSGPYTNVLVQTDVYYPGAIGAVKMGVLARYSSFNDYIMATLDCLSPVSKLSVKMETTANSIEILGTSEEYELSSGVAYTIRLQVNTAGQWALWFWQAGGTQPSAPILSGQHDDLISPGGLLDDGKVGIYDVNATATAVTRIYDSFMADGLTQPMDIQGLDFELVPIEYAAGKVATLNVDDSLGTDRPEAIFEYGSGSRSAKSYKRAISREGIVNLAYSLGDSVRVAFDIESQAARGLFEEVIASDVVDPGLRQVLVNDHVRVRKVPREIITFEPSTNAPVYGTDYVVGDTVRARAKFNDVARFNVTVRVYGIELNIDEEGKEVLVPTLVQE